MLLIKKKNRHIGSLSYGRLILQEKCNTLSRQLKKQYYSLTFSKTEDVHVAPTNSFMYLANSPLAPVNYYSLLTNSFIKWPTFNNNFKF